MAFHAQLARLRQGGGNFSLEDVRVVLLELWDRINVPPAPTPPPPPDDPYGRRRKARRDPEVEAP